jgi:hypothetical protein
MRGPVSRSRLCAGGLRRAGVDGERVLWEVLAHTLRSGRSGWRACLPCGTARPSRPAPLLLPRHDREQARDERPAAAGLRAAEHRPGHGDDGRKRRRGRRERWGRALHRPQQPTARTAAASPAVHRTAARRGRRLRRTRVKDRHGTVWGFVVVGVAMIRGRGSAGRRSAAAALTYLPDAVAVTFAVLGAALVVLGRIAGRLAPGEPQKFGPGGLEFVLASLSEAAEERNEPKAAKALAEAARAVDDDWFQDYLKHVRDHPEADPSRARAR